MAVWPGWGDGARASGPHFELSGELGVGRGAFRGVASSAGGRDAGDVRPDDLQGLSDGPVQAGRARSFLWSQGVALKDFTAYAKATTEQIAENARRLAREAGRPVISFDHVKTRHQASRKEDLARAIAERDGITEGIVCLISAVEPCWSFQVRRSHK